MKTQKIKEEYQEFDQVTLIFDIDGTLCPIKKKEESYDELIPFGEMVEKLRFYKEQGARIVLFTSRNMNTFKGNIGEINAITAKTLLAWLDKWEIPYDEIIYGKPWPGHKGFYIDDRTIRPKEFLEYSLEELEQLCEKGRIEDK